ncbi:MAG: YbaB/EbfC family nucleoid-associated protein [Gemmatimonadales bacterium]|nr:MAG: YbaB/EbfC family nucleoid-associated protein [Gemmatimonadales bacterium]
MDMKQLMQMGRKMQDQMAQMQEDLEARELSASAGGGMVTATVNGKGHVQGVSIDPTVVDPSDVEMLEDLVLAAVSEAQKKAAEAYEAELKKASGGLPFPMKLPGF